MAKQSLIYLQKSSQEIENIVWALYVVTFMIIAVWMQGFPPIDNNDIDPIAHPELTIPNNLAMIPYDSQHISEWRSNGIGKAIQDADNMDEHISLQVTHN